VKFSAKIKVRPICASCGKPIEGTIWTWQEKPYCGLGECLSGRGSNALAVEQCDEFMAELKDLENQLLGNLEI